MLCERCGKEVYKNEVCNYCKKKLCFNCVKSSRRVTKTNRIVICKDCWGKITKRKQFKSEGRVEVKQEEGPSYRRY